MNPSLNLLIESLLREQNLETLNRTFGVEFELCFNFKKFANEYKKQFTKPPHYSTVENYILDTNFDDIIFKILRAGGFKDWEPKYDESITATNEDDLTIEIVTPILFGEAGLNDIKNFLQYVSQFGAYVNSSCGGHVHIGAEDLIKGTKEQVASKIIIGALTSKKFEPLMNALIPPERVEPAKDFARGYSDIGEQDIEKAAALAKTYMPRSQEDSHPTVQLLLQHIYNFDRYRMINFVPLTKIGTIEFRIFDGTLNYQTIEERVKFGIAFVNLLAKVEVDIISKLKTFKDKQEEVFKKGPRTTLIKKVLRDIIALNQESKKELLKLIRRRIKTSYSKIDFNKEPDSPESKEIFALIKELYDGISNFKEYNKPVDLTENSRFIIFDFSGRAPELYKFKNMLQKLGITPITAGNKLWIDPVVSVALYQKNLKVIFEQIKGEETNLSQFAISPEEFLSRLNPSDAQPYIEQYKKRTISEVKSDIDFGLSPEEGLENFYRYLKHDGIKYIGFEPRVYSKQEGTKSRGGFNPTQTLYFKNDTMFIYDKTNRSVVLETIKSLFDPRVFEALQKVSNVIPEIKNAKLQVAFTDTETLQRNVKDFGTVDKALLAAKKIKSKVRKERFIDQVEYEKFKTKVLFPITSIPWYHATRFSNWASIKNSGLKPSKEAKKEQGEGWTQLNFNLQNAVYLTADKEYAERIAETLSDRFDEKAIVIKIEGSALKDLSKLVIDEDALRDEYTDMISYGSVDTEVPNFLTSVLSNYNSLGYTATISPQWLSIVEMIEPQSEEG